MKLIVWLIALFAAAVAVTLTAKHITGHASLVMPPYQLELPLDQFIIVVVVAFLVFYFLVRLTLGIFGFSRRHRHKKTDEMLLSGLKAYFEGDFVKAQKNAAVALKLANSATVKAISAVIAARSAHKLNQVNARDQYLNNALIQIPGEKSLCLATKAEFQLDDGNYQDALKTLQSLYSEGGLQPTAVLLLELEAQQRGRNWDAVLELTEVLEKRQSANKTYIKKLKHDAQIENIRSKTIDSQSLNQYWLHISPMEKMDSKLCAAAVRSYISLGNCATANRIIEQNVPITFVPVLSEPLPIDGWEGRTGLVHEAVMQDFKSLEKYQIYACGVPAMIKAAYHDFTLYCNLPKNAFFSDVFTPSTSNPSSSSI